MRELSLFSGAGGGLLGAKLLGWNCVGYVEIDDYCQRIIRQRIIDGMLERAPIFGDIRAFNSEGYAKSYKGMVDVITAGFPCQPFSVTGARRGADDPKNMWPETIRSIRLVRPRFCFLENVPGLFTSGYFGTILRDLAESGYNARWRCLSAAEVGAPHKRDRIWIMANSESLYASDPDRKRCEEQRVKEPNESGFTATKCGSRWPIEPDVGRMAHGMAGRVDRIKALGNGQVPQCMAAAWKILSTSV